jgi:hypothetical protein
MRHSLFSRSSRRFSSGILRGGLVAAQLLLLAQCSKLEPPQDEPQPTPDLRQADAPDLGKALPPVDTTRQFNALFLHKSLPEFSTWAKNGVALRAEGDGAVVQLAPSSAPLRCASEDIDGGVASFDMPSGLCTGVDPMPAGLPTGVNHYNGGAFYFGTMTSPEITTRAPIDRVIASWNATTTPGTWLQLHVRVKLEGGWSAWYRLPIWASDKELIKRHSVKVPADATAYVDTDTFMLRNQKTTSTYQLSVTLFSATATGSPLLRLIAAIASKDMKEYPSAPSDKRAWGTVLPVPPRSQELLEYRKPEYKEYGGGGQVWCSPTSTSMILEYYAQKLGRSDLNKTVPDTAIGCFDWVYQGTGNWPFNTAHAATLGLAGYVTRLYSFTEAEPYLEAGMPLVISIAFKAGELPGAPINATSGHLIVVRGFGENGDVLVNDPAAPDDSTVSRRYGRAALEAAWAHSHRTVYVIFPPNLPPPAEL